MYNNKHKQVIVAGNDFKIRITLEKMEDTYVPFDLTTCSDLHVYLLSSKSVDLHYEISQDETGVILATVDYRLVSPNTGYGIAVEGIDENNNHFRWEMKPSEGFYVVTNSSSMHAGEDIYTLDLAGRVGWGDPGYTKAQIDEKFDAVGDDIDRIDQSIEGIDGDIAELDGIVDGLTGDVADLQTDVQQLQSGVQNINSEISGIQTGITELQSGITELQTDIAELQSGISNIENELDNKQDTLIPGNFIEIINNEISAVGLVDIQEFNEQMQTKQDVLVSALNIKTINGESILGSGNIEIQGGSGVEQVQTDWNQTDIQAVDYIKNKPDLNEKQDVLVSAQNIKTINNESILGSGNIEIQAAAQEQADWNQTDIQAVDYIKNKPDIEGISQTVAKALNDHKTQIDTLNSTIPQKIEELESNVDTKIAEVNSSLSEVNTTVDLLSKASASANDELTNKTEELTDKVDELTDKVEELTIDYAKEYLTFEAVEDGTFTFIYGDYPEQFTSMSYSIDGGETWVTYNYPGGDEPHIGEGLTTPVIQAGNKVLWKGIAKRILDGGDNYEWSPFTSTGKYNVYGNLLSLLYGDDFATETAIPSDSEQKDWAGLFYEGRIVSAKNLILPQPNASDYFSYFFYGNTYLIEAPELPATTLTVDCYMSMFEGCTSLTTAPKLPATTLAYYCYGSMFYGCTSLTTAPELPATTLADICYIGMFYGCTSLTTAPELPATTLVHACYNNMFSGCTNLNYIKMLATDISATNCLVEWTNGVSATGTFVKNVNATWDVTGNSGVPTNWTVKSEDTGYVDNTPTDGSYNSVTSDGIKTYVDTLDSTSVKSSTTGLKIEVVSQMPATPDQNTIYLVQ